MYTARITPKPIRIGAINILAISTLIANIEIPTT